MIRLTITTRSGSVTRRLDGPLCLDPADTPTQRGPCVVRPFGTGATVHNADGRLVGRVDPGMPLSVGFVELTIAGDDVALTPLGTERIVAVGRPQPLSLSLPDGRSVALSGDGLVIGSARGCGLVLDDPAVSGRHCQVVAGEGSWVATDLGSTNGLWVSGVRVAAAELHPGAVLTLGRSQLRCVANRPPARDAWSLVGDAPSIAEVRSTVTRFAPAPYSVLVEGESGVGKELVARELHARGPRRDGPLVTVNCAAIAPEVIESELFGHERGAFTGAVQRRRGLFELAHRGTLFLDEVGELPSGAQAKLLRVLETGELRRVGGETEVKVDVRVVSATLRDLRAMVSDGRFRPDLYFRLADFRVTVPPLRERRTDIPLLVEALLARVSEETGRNRRLEDRALARLMVHDWPGNVRELLSVLKRAVYLTDGARIGPEHLEFSPAVELVDASYSGARPRPAEQVSGVRDNGWPEAPVKPRHAWPPEVPADDIAALYRYCKGNVSRLSKITGLARSTVRDRVARAMGSYPPPPEPGAEPGAEVTRDEPSEAAEGDEVD